MWKIQLLGLSLFIAISISWPNKLKAQNSTLIRFFFTKYLDDVARTSTRSSNKVTSLEKHFYDFLKKKYGQNEVSNYKKFYKSMVEDLNHSPYKKAIKRQDNAFYYYQRKWQKSLQKRRTSKYKIKEANKIVNIKGELDDGLQESIRLSRRRTMLESLRRNLGFDGIDEIINAQNVLKELKYYDGLINGKWGRGSKKAFQKFKDELIGEIPHSKVEFKREGVLIKQDEEQFHYTYKKLSKKKVSDEITFCLLNDENWILSTNIEDLNLNFELVSGNIEMNYKTEDKTTSDSEIKDHDCQIKSLCIGKNNSLDLQCPFGEISLKDGFKISFSIDSVNYEF